jgi:glycosyltransferase involved in cell wall biosynthesis
MWRLLHPVYLRLAIRFLRLLGSPQFYYLPMGVHAAKDIQRLFRLFSFVPHALLNHSPLTTRRLLSKLLLWGYFVEPSDKINDHFAARKEPGGSEDEEHSTHALTHSRTHEPLRVLWVGRMLNWKRVDTLIKAVRLLIQEGRNVRLTLVGQGPEELKLRKLAACVNSGKSASRKDEVPPVSSFQFPVSISSSITFHPPVPIAQIRDWMRHADVYVLASDGGEGWGAVVNEALAEGCAVIATHECGAGKTLLKHGENGFLFHAGNGADLAHCLCALQDNPALRLKIAKRGAETVSQIWSPDIAAQRLLSVCEAILSGREVPHFDDGLLDGVAL